MEVSQEERLIYEWQSWVPDFGEAGQQTLKDATVLISRVGGLGGLVAYELAAAGIGKLILAHAGKVKPSDLNRQLLMTHESIGQLRVETAKRRLLELNPRLVIDAVAENIDHQNAMKWVSQVDIVVDCAPMFEERLAMNRAAVALGKPMIECAMFELEGSLTTFSPGKTPCLACLTPEPPKNWSRKFPVFGAVSGTVGCMAAMEVIKVLCDMGTPLYGSLLTFDLRTMQFRRSKIEKRLDCSVCGSLP